MKLPDKVSWMSRFTRALARLGAVLLTATLAACSGFSFFVANAPTALGTSFKRTGDLAYGADARQRLDVYAPKGASASAKNPIVVFFYGGSWTMGKRSEYAFVGAALATRGFVTVIPDYRLYPQVRFPEFMDDAARAVAWVQQHVEELGGDPERIVLMGHSAGAHMAAMLAFNDAYLVKAGGRPDSIVGLVGLSGPYALDPNTDTLRTIFSSPYTLADWQPVRFVSTRSPPTLLLHGLDDKLVAPSHTQKLRDALAAMGVPVETHLYPGHGHADTIASFTLVARYRTPALEQTVEFLRRVTAQGRASAQGPMAAAKAPAR
jgi:acetyl esterase/lipase